MSTTTTPATRPMGRLAGWLRALHNVQLGPGSRPAARRKMSRRELQFLLTNLATLISNGLSLPRALATLGQERSLKKHRGMLKSLRRKVESGEPFSSALAEYSATFKPLMIHQVEVGEQTGTIPDVLWRLTGQVEKAGQLRSKILKRLTYPALVVLAGTGLLIFLLAVVVPQFEVTFNSSNIPLPLPTRMMIATSDYLASYGWVAPIGIAGLLLGWRQARRNRLLAQRIDRFLLRIPVVGPWLRDIAMFQFMQAMGIMLQSGFKVVDALGAANGAIGNRAVKESVRQLQRAVIRGERLSREMCSHTDIFSPVVSQLVVIGEQTGKLADTTGQVEEQLRQQIEKRTDAMVGSIEPVLTASMAVAIGFIVVSIYLPMFDMMDAIG